MSHRDRMGERFKRDLRSLDGLLESARQQSNPEAWVRRRVADALERLERSDRNPELINEARRQLHLIEKQILASLAKAG